MTKDTKNPKNPKGDAVIGNRIKELRIRNALTQKRLAELVMVSASSIARLETGQSMVSVFTMIKIAEALNVSTSALLMDAHQNVYVDEDLRAISTKLKNCTPAQRQKFIHLMEETIDAMILN